MSTAAWPGQVRFAGPALVGEWQTRLADGPETEAMRSETRRLVRAAMADLLGRDAEVLTLRFGLADATPRTLDAVGAILDLSTERIRQIEARGLRRLRRPAKRLADLL